MDLVSIVATAAKWLLTSQVGRALLLATALGAALWWAYATVHARGVEEGRAEIQAEFDKHLAADAEATRLAEEAAREQEKRQRDAYRALEIRSKQELEDALRQADARTAAAVAARTLRLRREWAGCETSRLSGTAATAALAAELEQLRDASARRIIRIGAAADARERELQAALMVCTGGAR